MPIRYATFFSLFLPAASFAQTDLPVDVQSFQAVDLTQLSKSEFIDIHEEAFSIGWEPSMELFARVDESLAEIVPQFEWSDQYVETYGCLYDRLKEQDALHEANAMFSGMLASIEYIYANPDLSMLTLTEHDAFIDMQQPSDPYLEASMSCGLAELNIQAMKNSGLYDAFTAFMLQ